MKSSALDWCGGRYTPNWRPLLERNKVTDFIEFHRTMILSVNDQIQIIWTAKHYSVENKRSKDFKNSGKKVGHRYSPRSTYKGFSLAQNKGTKITFHSTNN